MPHIHKAAICLYLITTPALADIVRPTVSAQPSGWPSWAVVLVTFTLFLGLIILLSRFIRADRGGSNNGGDDNSGLFGP